MLFWVGLVIGCCLGAAIVIVLVYHLTDGGNYDN